MNEENEENEESVFKDEIERITRDLLDAGITLGRDEARFLVDCYYRMQNDRKRSNSQLKELGDKPHEILEWFATQATLLENQVAAALGAYAPSTPAGRWMLSICGIGPILTSGLMAHIDMGKVDSKGRTIEYAGQIFSFAGLTNEPWLPKTKRPWNAELKKLCWLIGQSFVKQKSNKNDFYGQLIQERKDWEWQQNINGDFSEQATTALNAKNWSKDTNAKKWYSGQILPTWAEERLNKETSQTWPVSIPKKAIGNGIAMLPPAHIDARARRWGVKLFLSHMFEVMYIEHNGKMPPEAYILTQPGHNRKIPVPGFDEWMRSEGFRL